MRDNQAVEFQEKLYQLHVSLSVDIWQKYKYVFTFPMINPAQQELIWPRASDTGIMSVITWVHFLNSNSNKKFIQIARNFEHMVNALFLLCFAGIIFCMRPTN